MESKCLSRIHVYSTNKELLPPPWWKDKYSQQCSTRALACPTEEWSHQGGFSATVTMLPVLSHIQLCDLMDWGSLFSVHGIFLGKNTGTGCYFLLKGIFLTQGLNPRLLHLLNWQADSLPLSHSLKLVAKLALMKICQDFWSYYILIIHLLIYCGQFFFLWLNSINGLPWWLRW